MKWTGVASLVARGRGINGSLQICSETGLGSLERAPSSGLISASRPEEERTETLVAPLLHPPNMEPHLVPGILGHIGIRPMQLKLGG